MPLVKNDEVSVVELAPGVRQRPLVNAKTGAAGISMGEVTIAPGSAIPWHYHSIEDIILVRQGKGYVETTDEVYEVSGGISVIIPPLVHHHVVNTGTEPIQIIFGFPSANVDRILVEGK